MRVILTGFLTDHELFQTRQTSERVNNNLTNFRVFTQEQLSLRDVPGVIRDSMGNVTARQRGHGDDRDRTSGRELHGLLVNLRQIGIQ